MTSEVLHDKVAIVTGGASGIGRAIAKRFADEGARVVIGDLQVNAGQEAARQIGGLFVETDVSQSKSCRALVDRAVKAYQKVDVLVNNAGFQHVDPVDAFPEDVWEKMLAVMLTGPFLLTRYVWPSMKAQRWGRIINMSSIHGMVASPFKSAYISAKHGLIGLTRTTALEGGEYGITVNAICPAYVRTPLVEDQIADQARTRGISEDEVVQKVMLEPAAVKRLIEPEEVADLAAYLCSEPAGVVTGAAWTMDLGWTAR